MGCWDILEHPQEPAGLGSGCGGLSLPPGSKCRNQRSSEVPEFAAAFPPEATASIKDDLGPLGPLHFQKKSLEGSGAPSPRQSRAGVGSGCCRTRGCPQPSVSGTVAPSHTRVTGGEH